MSDLQPAPPDRAAGGERSAGAPATHVALLSAPELPAEIATDLADELPEMLAQRHAGTWRAVVAEQPLLEEGGAEAILDAAREQRAGEDWDLAICLTDVPLRMGTRPLVAAATSDERAAVVAVPAFGATLLRLRVREATVGLVGELVGAADSGAGPPPLVRRRAGDLVTPIRRVVTPGERIGVSYALPRALGHLRLLSGMVRANRPWRALAGLSSAVVAAFATGAYAMLSVTVWQLSDSLGWARLLAIMLAAVGAMLGWLIVAHGLWESARRGRPAKDAALYNAATVATLALALLCGYAAVFVLVLGISSLLIDDSTFRPNVGHHAGLGDYVALAWLAASIATVAGALGSGLESIEEVRHAAYGHNQRRRDRRQGGSG